MPVINEGIIRDFIGNIIYSVYHGPISIVKSVIKKKFGIKSTRISFLR